MNKIDNTGDRFDDKTLQEIINVDESPKRSVGDKTSTKPIHGDERPFKKRPGYKGALRGRPVSQDSAMHTESSAAIAMCQLSGTSESPRVPRVLSQQTVEMTLPPFSQLFGQINSSREGTAVAGNPYAASPSSGVRIMPSLEGYKKIEHEDGIYEGETKNGIPYGVGTKVFNNSKKYIGQFQNGKPHGQGRMAHPSGHVYTGQWQNGRPHGQGKVTRPNGSVGYEGQFQNGMPHGQGKFTHPNGSVVYEGQFQNGNRHGQGKVTRPNGSVGYEGQFQNEMRHGQGKVTRSDGRVYAGQWQNGKAHGQGKLTYPDGCIYEGQLQNGKPHGQGKETSPNGSVACEGLWKNGNFVKRQK